MATAEYEEAIGTFRQSDDFQNGEIESQTLEEQTNYAKEFTLNRSWEEHLCRQSFWSDTKSETYVHEGI